MINKLFLTLMLALTAWVFAGCGEARFAGKNITVPQFVLKVPEVDTNPPPKMSPPSQKLPQDPLEERETGIGAIACEERPELCPVGDETCPDKTIETILNEKKICRPESSCENHPELCVPKCASNLVLNPLTLKCEPITPPPLKCVPPEVFDAQSNLCGVVNPPQPPPPQCLTPKVLNASTKSCVCPSNMVEKQDGTCENKPNCVSPQRYDASTNSCITDPFECTPPLVVKLGTTVCVPPTCPNGMQWDTVDMRCEALCQNLPGTTLNKTTQKCECPGGQVWSTALNKCESVCKGGSTWNSTSQKCECPTGRIWSSTKNQCEVPTCPEGFAWDWPSLTCKSICTLPQKYDPSTKKCVAVVEKKCPEDLDKCPKREEYHMPDSTLPGAVDIVWVVDSSGSMANKRTIVRQNIQSFMTRISQYAKQKVALITRIYNNSEAPMTLPSVPGVSTVNVNAYVNSTTPLIMAAAASCPSNTNFGPPGQNEQGNICGKFVDWGKVTHWGNGTSTEPAKWNIYDASGCLYGGMTTRSRANGACPIPSGSSFFRPDTKRVYIFVTDDDSVNYSGGSFMAAVKPLMNGGPAGLAACEISKTCNIPLVFVFGATEKSVSQCNATIASGAYAGLVQWTGGTYTKDSTKYPFFNVCTQNWSPYFNHMISEIHESAMDSLYTAKPIVPGSLSVRVLRTYYKLVNNKLVEDTTRRTPVTSTDRTRNRLLVEGRDYTVVNNRIILREGAVTMATKPNSEGEVVRAFYRYPE